MATAVFMTYNTVGRDGAYSNGAVQANDHAAIVFQHPRGQTWGVPDPIPKAVGDPICAGLVRDVYTQVFGLAELPDHIVVYVGASGSEGAIHLAARLPHERVTFVLCDCDWSDKLRRIAAAGMSDAQVVRCECGGHRTMAELLRRFLSCGRVGS